MEKRELFHSCLSSSFRLLHESKVIVIALMGVPWSGIFIISLLAVLMSHGALAATEPLFISFSDELQVDTVPLVPVEDGHVPGEILIWQGGEWMGVAGQEGRFLRMDSTTPSWGQLELSSTVELGCTDPNACNFNPDATALLAGSCNYTDCLGCTDSLFAEYTPGALIDDGSCLTRRGCTDPDAGNFEPEAVVDNESCEYNGIDLVIWVDGGGVPGAGFYFEAQAEADVASFSDWTFYVNGEAVQQDEGRFFELVLDTTDVSVYATANHLSGFRSTDTLFIPVEYAFVDVPLVFEMSEFIDDGLGSGIRFYSSLDTLELSYSELMSAEGFSLQCDFSEGVEIVSGEVFPSDELMQFSLNYLESNDTLRINVENTALGLTMCMPALVTEGTNLLNFVEQQIGGTTDYDALLGSLSSTLSNSGFLDLTLEQLSWADAMATEIRDALPVLAEMPNSACPSGGDGNYLADWPQLRPDSEGNLIYEDCGIDLSYSVQAITNHPDGTTTTSKSYIFSPEFGLVGDLFNWLRYKMYPTMDAFEFRVGPFADATLKPQDLVGGHLSGSSAIVVSRRNNAWNGFDASVGGQFPSSNKDFLLHLLDVVPLGLATMNLECEQQLYGQLNVIYGAAENLNAIIVNGDLSEVEKASQVVDVLFNSIVPSLKDAIAAGCIKLPIRDKIKFGIWVAGVELSVGTILIAQVLGELASYSIDYLGGQSYMTRQTLVDGKFRGTPMLHAMDGSDVYIWNGVEHELINSEALATAFPLAGTYYTDFLNEGVQIEQLIGDGGWLGASHPISTNVGLSTADLELDWWSFVATLKSGKLLQVTKDAAIPAPTADEMKIGVSMAPPSMFSYPIANVFQYEPSVPTPPMEWPEFNDLLFANAASSSPKWSLGSLTMVEGPDCTDSEQPRVSMGSFSYAGGVEDERTAVHGTAVLRYEPMVKGASDEWVPLPSVPNVFVGYGPNGPALGMPFDVYHGIWDTHAWIQGDLLAEEELGEGLEGLGHPMFNAALNDTLLVQGDGGSFTIHGPNHAGIPEDLAIEIAVSSGAIAVDPTSPWGGSAFILSQSDQSVKLRYSKDSFFPHVSIEYLPDDVVDEDTPLPVLTVKLWTQCEVPELLGEWRAVLKPTGGCVGQSTLTFDGYTYDLVQIGDQCWFAENLRSDHYRNGDAIPGNLPLAAWTSTTSGAQTAYGEVPSSDYDWYFYSAYGSAESNLATFGRLYNWYAVNDGRGLCPTGWHVPTDGEWMALEMALGMTSSEANSTGGRGYQGAQLKSSPSDSPGWNGSNASGFSALPGGYRNPTGSGEQYYGRYDYGYWWSSSPIGSGDAWFRHLYTGTHLVYRNSLYGSWITTSPNGLGDMILRWGLSVRCVRD